MGKKYFGTDGIRGTVGQSPITPEFMLKLGWAAGKVFSEQGNTRMLIGKDTRISGYMFESSLEAGLVAAGVDVLMLGPMPTPAIAYLARTFRSCAGIVISASHNPFHDNGIKFFSGKGQKLDDEMEAAIEALIDQPMDMVPSAKLGKTRRVEDARGRYIEFCKGTIDRSVSFEDLTIVVDCANGATYKMAPDVLSELGAKVVPIGVEPNGLNINLDCGSTSLGALRRKVLEIGADLGVAFDGDGDRLMMVDHAGEVVDGDELIYIIAKNHHENGGINGGVVGTLMTNYGFELAMKDMGVEFLRANVGDRYVMELLKERGWFIGGESSGHILCLDKTSTGDGIVSALQVLSALVESGKSLFELKKGMSKLPQTMINVRLPQKMDVIASERVAASVAEVEAVLEGRGRVLLRASGTEPLIRVMVEGDVPEEVGALAQQIADVVESVVSCA
ncbi:phosphoglucosamine mutase [Gammaproteobacteria bacterium 45_16_T64]|nr:phosphoglucosamine mutase [Gammaproteobacteria bacterium 45_16_T64]